MEQLSQLNQRKNVKEQMLREFVAMNALEDETMRSHTYRLFSEK